MSRSSSSSPRLACALRVASLALAASLLPTGSRADFLYADFNETAGLRFNGGATTSSCDDGTRAPYASESPAHGANDLADAGSQAPVVDEDADVVREHTSATVERADAARTQRFLSGFPHADKYGLPPYRDSPDGCAVRLRLTAARPFQRGSVMRLTEADVAGGFETGFTLQVTDPSRACTLVKDAAFGATTHKICSVRGGDGLAFVVHGDANASAALGRGGAGLGYAGIRNGIAVEFDSECGLRCAAVLAVRAGLRCRR